MTLGLILAIGESFGSLKKQGQDALVVEQNLKAYSRHFDKVIVFSYAKEKYSLPQNNELIENKFNLHRYIYALFLPLINLKKIRECNVLRGFQITGGIPCVLSRVFLKKPFVVNYGYDYEQIAKLEGKRLLTLFYKIVTFIVLKFADAVIITSPSLKSKIDKYSPRRIEFIPNSVDTKLFSPTNIKRKKIKRIIFVGRLEKQKNLLSLIEAVSPLDYKIKLIFIGDGSQKSKLLKFASRKKVDLEIIKPVPHDKLPSFLNSADIFVLPSFIEGHPKVLLEAMSIGLPCIGSNVEGIREIISHNKNGIITQTDSKSIRNGLLKLLGNKSLQKRLGQNARKFVVNNFDSRLLLEKETNLLLKLVK